MIHQLFPLKRVLLHDDADHRVFWNLRKLRRNDRNHHRLSESIIFWGSTFLIRLDQQIKENKAAAAVQALVKEKSLTLRK